MPRIIQVTGLPRSGTAWVTNLLNLHPECVAYHEPMAWRKDWRAMLEGTPSRFVACCSTVGYLPEFFLEAEAHVALVRNPLDAQRAVNACGMRPIQTDEKFAWLTQAFQAYRDRKDVLQVKFENLFTYSTAGALWAYAFESVPALEDRLKLTEVCKLRVMNSDPRMFERTPI